jgi:hypothetical protein
VALVPAGVVTVTSTAPLPAGAVAVMEVELLTVKVAGLPDPKSTAVAPTKFEPVIMVREPLGPEFGPTPVTIGAEEVV